MFNESDVSMEEKSINEVSVPEEENIGETDELVALDSLTDEESVAELAALDGEETEENSEEDGETMFYKVTFFKGAEGFYSVSFITNLDNLDSYGEKFEAWAESVVVD